MLKKVLVLILTVVIGLGSAALPSQAQINKQDNDGYRGGFSIIPQNSDSTGVNILSKYTLKTKTEITMDELNQILSIDGEPQPIIQQKSTYEFEITPSKTFEENTLYTFRMKTDINDVTWTFQTSSQFKIVRTLPGDKTNGVPINTGIEIYFNNENYEDINNYFEITPKVDGRFERHNKTAVFVPKGLKQEIIYTVTLKKGLKIKGSDTSEIKEDYQFSFETESQNTNPPDQKIGNIYYKNTMNDYSSNDLIYIPIDYYRYNNSSIDPIQVKSQIFAYKSADLFADAVNGLCGIPQWASYTYWNTYVKTDGLTNVMSFEQELNNTNDSNKKTQFINLPSTLPKGYYLIDSYWENIHFQSFIQVTDTCMYVTKSNGKSLVWLNSLASKEPIAGASVSVYGNDTKAYSDNNGVAFFDTPKADPLKSNTKSYYQSQLLKVVTKDGDISFINYQDNPYSYYNENNYWQYFATDRDLYKPDDTIDFWGFLQNRYNSEELNEVTVELQKGSSYYYQYGGYWPGGSDVPLEKSTVNIQNGMYQGNLKIPALEPGGYTLVLKKGDDLIESKYISIENYTKPAYKIELSSDKKAVFPGEQVNFGVAASFFEGTGVSNLKVDYNIYNNNDNISGSNTTDGEGKTTISYIPSDSNYQGINYARLNVRSQLPESAEISDTTGVRVFMNNINASLDGSIQDNKGTIKAKVNQIVLDRLNDGTAKDESDYLGEGVSGKNLSVSVIKNEWIQIEDGEYYDFINKVTSKRYRYEKKETDRGQYEMTTDANGEGELSFDTPDLKNGYYSAKVTTTDLNGKSMSFDVYLGQDYIYYNNYYNDYYNNRYHLDDGKIDENYYYDEGEYTLNDTVNLTFKKGEQPLESGRFLYLQAQNGIKNFEVSDNSTYSFTFDKDTIPNVMLKGICFNGNTYIETQEYIAKLNYNDMELVIDATADKECYRPGDTVQINISTKDKNGNPCKAFVNASIVDEALFALNDQTINVLPDLYTRVYSGIEFSACSHANSGTDTKGGTAQGSASGGKGGGGGGAPIPAPQAPIGDSVSNSNAPREDFKDTAFFETIETDDNGQGVIQFKLPDNVTSWRVTLSGISNDLHAGNGNISLKVSLPMFINYSLNTTYLAGDKPILGINAYGDALKEGDTVTFEVWNSMFPDQKVSVDGKAFERINIPLWELSEGKYDIMMSAKSSDALSDSVKQSITVYNTYHEIEKAVYNDASTDMQIAGGNSGMTELVFKDKGRGKFLPELLNLGYSGGNRIDQKLSRVFASDMLQKYFKDYESNIDFSDFDPSDYQREDGGISLLPYDSSDVELSAKLAGILKDKVDQSNLKNYFYTILDNEPNNIYALYGLSCLREPVLLNLDKAANVDNASIKDLLYIASAYCEIGETTKAAALFENKILQNIEEYKPFLRVNVGNKTDNVLECTGVAANLTVQLGGSEAEGLYNYCVSNYSDEQLINIEKMNYIRAVMDNYQPGEGKLTYNWIDGDKTLTFGHGETYVVTIPSQKLSDFKIADVQGDVGVILVFQQNVSDFGKMDSNISVTRKYLKADGSDTVTNEFKQGDIIKVELTCDVGDNAIDDSYEVTDFLPSGLKAIEGDSENFIRNNDKAPNMWWVGYKNVDGQKIRFYTYKHSDLNWDKRFIYYARVVSPGIYKADSAIIQGTRSRESINLSESDTINIKMADGMKIAESTQNSIKVIVDGRELVFDVNPVLDNDRVLVPFRAILEALGAEVTWDDTTKTVTGQKEDLNISLTIDSNQASINGDTTVLDVAPCVIDSRTMIPVRFISQSVGADVSWDESTKTVTIQTSK